MKFIHSSGQRVLDSYTLKRGIGRGGFGEVYYALSDGGKEVALKLVHGNNLDVEMRGMAQCLNLKHPNLLTLYDLRTDGDGDHWVLMEFIAGEPLSQVLNRHPTGVPLELAQQWFQDLAKAIGYLHDQGIVHRDLKPANIFIEHGAIKVGDYGLCKFISSSQRTAQTQSVGTVHYMAPEISTGNYNKQIDIYASGIILFEMLTGHVPFEGESAGEILMKHLTTPPDLTKIPAAFVPVLTKALAKNPAHRYASMAEMAQAVLAATEPAKPRVAVVEEPRSDKVIPINGRRPALPVEEPIPSVLPAVSVRGLVGELCGSMTLTVLLAALFCLVWARVADVQDWTKAVSGFFLVVTTCWTVLIPAKVWNERGPDSSYRRLVMLFLGIGLGLATMWLDGWNTGTRPPPHNWDTISAQSDRVPGSSFSIAGLDSRGMSIPAAAGYLSYFGLVFFAIRWWKMADRNRPSRFSFFPLLATAFWSFIMLWLIYPWTSSPRAAVALILSSAIIQLVSPWEQPPPPSVKRVRLRYA